METAVRREAKRRRIFMVVGILLGIIEGSVSMRGNDQAW
jgi:hypothetical protein